MALIARALSKLAADRPGALEFGDMFVRATHGVPVHHQDSRGRFFLVVAATNTIGYLLGALPPVFIDPTTHERTVYGARSYPQAWMIGPLSVGVFIATAFSCSRFPRKAGWLALVPPFLAGIATIPILAEGGEIPHARLTSVLNIWIVLTGIWLGTRELLNSPDSDVAPILAQNRNNFLTILLSCIAVLAIAPIPVLLILNHFVSALSESPADVSRLLSVAWFDAGTWALFWLAGPTREAAIAWRREASIVHRS